MNTRLQTLLLPLLLLSLSRPEALAQAATNLLVKDGQKVAFMGDSITQFGWSSGPGGYVQLVVSGLATLGVKIVPIPAGVAGNTSKDVLARLDEAVLSKQPDWMTLNCGINDVWHNPGGVDLETFKKDMTAIADQTQAKGIKELLLTATMIGEDLSNANNQKLAPYNDFLRQLAKERNLPLGDLNAAFQVAIPAATGPGSTHFTNDGVHVNTYGNRIMAEGVLRAFGATDGQIVKVKEVWDQTPGGAVIGPQVPFVVLLPVTFRTYDDFNQRAAARQLTGGQLQTSMLLKACGTVLQAHAQDEVLDSAKIQGEVQQEFTRMFQAFLAAPPAPAPPKTAP